MTAKNGSARILPWPRNPLGRQPGPEREFLPAALEIIETPASPVGRAIAGTIILFFVIAVLWATLGHVDIIAVAQGKIVPSGRSKVIQPFETGVVRAIHVRDGQAVKAGDVLIELDPTIDGAERDRLKKELTAARLDEARLRAVVATDPAASFTPPAEASPSAMDLQRALLATQVEEYRTKLANLDRQIGQSAANCTAVEATINKLTGTIPLMKRRVAARKYLADQGYGSKLVYLQEDQDLIEHEEELKVQQARLQEAAAGLAALKEQRLQAQAEFGRNTLSDLAQAQQKAASLEQELIKAEQRRDLETLKAPVDGTVQQLAVHTVGGVVTTAQQLAVIVPEDSKLEIEASIANRDIGFIHEGLDAEIKVDAFNFTEYGLLHGKVVNVSQDAVAREIPVSKEDSSRLKSTNDSSEPNGQELVYIARFVLDRTRMSIDDRLVLLTPGMAVSAEIKTGRRRIIDYLLSPVIRYRHEAMRER